MRIANTTAAIFFNEDARIIPNIFGELTIHEPRRVL